jgi:hypothetical protein
MRNYIAKINLPEITKNMNTGKIAEVVFQKWFKSNYQGEKLHPQLADMDYKGIDFADNKGITYQVKGTRGRTFTFNCHLSALDEHLRAKLYVCIQVKEKAAYIESIYHAEEILEKAKQSHIEDKSCFIWAKDLQQYKLEL